MSEDSTALELADMLCSALYPWGDPSRGGGRLRQPPPFVDPSVRVSPWVRVRVFGTSGQQCVFLPVGFPMGLSTEH